MHALGTPLAFTLSQDQTLQRKLIKPESDRVKLSQRSDVLDRYFIGPATFWIVKVLSSFVCNEKELAQSNSLRELTRCADKTEIYILSLFSSLILVQKTFFVKLSTVISFKT